MANPPNTAARRLQKDIEGIIEVSGMDYQFITAFQDDEARWLYLVRLRAVLVRGIVIDVYTTIDEMLGSEICAYLFSGTNFQRMWRGEKFKNFNHYVLERMTTHHKLAFVKKILGMSNSIVDRVSAIIALRNEVGHVLFPENLRAHKDNPKSRNRNPMYCPYKGRDVFTPDGLRRLYDDVQDVTWYFRHHGKVFRARNKNTHNNDRMISFT
jgi:hypothetical protein